jgi:hypothetical protein
METFLMGIGALAVLAVFIRAIRVRKVSVGIEFQKENPPNQLKSLED